MRGNHGINRWKRAGCRCDICTQEHAEYLGRQADQKRSRHNPDWFLEVDDFPPLTVSWIRENLPGELEAIWGRPA